LTKMRSVLTRPEGPRKNAAAWLMEQLPPHWFGGWAVDIHRFSNQALRDYYFPVEARGCGLSV
jgi:hypothetical protein